MQTNVRSTHRWHPLNREWERQLRSENKSPKTIEVYLEAVWQLALWLDQLPETPDESADSDAPDSGLARPAEPADITKSHVIGWINHLLAIHSPATANNRYRAVQQWFNWLLNEGEIDAHPMARMKPPTIPEKEVPLVPLDLIRKILADCDGRDLISRRDTAIIRLIWDTGCRLSEIGNLTMDDLDLDLDVIHVVGKGRRRRSVPFSPKTGQALARYLRIRATDKWATHERLWLAEKGKGPLTANGIKLMLRRRGKAIGIKEEIGRNLHAHLGRHSVAHEWQAAGGSEGDLMRIMGWKSPQMARRYGASAADQRAHATARRLGLGDHL
jgi:integrase